MTAFFPAKTLLFLTALCAGTAALVRQIWLFTFQEQKTPQPRKLTVSPLPVLLRPENHTTI